MVEPRVMPVVKASEIETMLNEGKSRKEIAAHYGIPVARLSKVIKACPQLAGKKKATSPFVFQNDLEETPVKADAAEPVNAHVPAEPVEEQQ